MVTKDSSSPQHEIAESVHSLCRDDIDTPS